MHSFEEHFVYIKNRASIAEKYVAEFSDKGN